MAGSVNKVIIVGNLGKDPEVRSFSNGGKVVNLSVATSDTWKDRSSGEQKERTEWNKVAIFNEHLAEIAEKYLRKGSKVYLEGKLQTRKWQDQSGQDKYMTEVVLQGFDCKLVTLDSRQQSGADERYGDESYQRDYGGGKGGKPTAPAAGGAKNPDMWNADDDDVPF